VGHGPRLSSCCCRSRVRYACWHHAGTQL